MNKPPRLAMAILMSSALERPPLAISSRNTQLADRACGSGGRRSPPSPLGQFEGSTSAVANSRGHDDRLGGAVTALRSLWRPHSERTGKPRVGLGSADNGIWHRDLVAVPNLCRAGLLYRFRAVGVGRCTSAPREPGDALAYVASVTAGLIVSAVILEVLIHRYDRVPFTHTLFYLVSVTLPFHWRSGFLLAPLVMVVCGLAVGEQPGSLDGRSGDQESFLG